MPTAKWEGSSLTRTPGPSASDRLHALPDRHRDGAGTRPRRFRRRESSLPTLPACSKVRGSQWVSRRYEPDLDDVWRAHVLRVLGIVPCGGFLRRLAVLRHDQDATAVLIRRR